MGRAIGPHNAGPVQGKGDGKVLQADVVEDLIKAPLQERGIDGGHRPHTLDSEPGGKGDGVLLGDADIETALGIGLLEEIEACAIQHGRSHRHDLLVLPGQFRQGTAENLGVAGRSRPGRVGYRLLHDPGFGIEGGHTMPLEGILHGRVIAKALLGLHVQQDGALGHLLAGFHQSLG